MSDSSKTANLREGTNSFYCTDQELLDEANSLIEQSDEFRSVSHFLSVCLREKVDSEKKTEKGDAVSVIIDDKELVEYVTHKHEDGEFYNEEHVVTIALERMREDDKGQMLV